jgi:hypothetical protein
VIEKRKPSQSVSAREAQNHPQFALNQRKGQACSTCATDGVHNHNKTATERGTPSPYQRKWSVRLIFRPQEPTLDIGDLISGGSADAKESAVWPTHPRPTATSSPLLACDPGPRGVHCTVPRRGATCTKLREDKWRFSRGAAKVRSRWRLAQRLGCATLQLLIVGSAPLCRSYRALVPIESSNPPPALIRSCRCA